jgi:hypothetical protein
MRIAILVVLCTACLAAADPAAAALSSVRVHEVVPTPSRRSAVRTVTARFDLVGLHWRGSGAVELRVRTAGGGWSAWREAAPEREEGPDATGGEGAAGDGWTRGSPWWAGGSGRLQLRTTGNVTGVRVYTVRSPEQLVPLRRSAAPSRPSIVMRSAWGADETIVRGRPAYAPELRFAVVHHTAGSSGYSRSEAAAIVRGIQLYHVQANGWNDIGYNFLVDRFGTVYEGRAGGIDANVVGAHAQGFNTGSVGVAVLGTYGSTAPSAAAESAVSRLLAWRLDRAHVDPQSMLTVTSGGSPKHPAGMPVLLRAVSGHRDVGATECPGNALFSRLGQLAVTVAAEGAPKLFEPVVDASDPAAVSFRARLSSSLDWRVTVVDAGGRTVAEGSGAGDRVDWSWDSTAAAPGTYRWTMEAGDASGSATPASGEVTAGAAPALAIEDAAVDPAVLTPNGDGQSDVGVVRFRLAAAATVALTVLDQLGLPASEVEPARWRRAGLHAVAVPVDTLADGRYAIDLLARSATGEEARASAEFAVTRVLAGAVLSPEAISPNADGRADTLRIAFSMSRPARVRIQVARDGGAVTTVWRGALASGRHAVRWDGRKPSGVVGDGSFLLAIEADDGIAVARTELAFRADRTPPVVEVLTRAPLRLRVSEPARLRVEADGTVERLAVTRPGVVRVTLPVARRLRVQAWDAAGNAATPVARSWPEERAQ